MEYVSIIREWSNKYSASTPDDVTVTAEPFVIVECVSVNFKKVITVGNSIFVFEKRIAQ